MVTSSYYPILVCCLRVRCYPAEVILFIALLSIYLSLYIYI